MCSYEGSEKFNAAGTNKIYARSKGVRVKTVWSVEINNSQPSENRQRLFFSELAAARESDTITFVLAETQRQAAEWESFTEAQREDFRYALMSLLWSITASLLNFCPGFQLRTNQRKPNMLP